MVCAGKEAAGFLPWELLGASSTARELAAVECGIRAHAERLKGKKACVFMDSTAACRNLIKGGGGKQDLTNQCKNIWALCQELKADVQFAWLPREENKEADALSRLCPSVAAQPTRARLVDSKVWTAYGSRSTGGRRARLG